MHPDPAPAAGSHTITLKGGGNQEYKMSPDDIEAKAGDTLIFLVESGGPHTLAMSPAGMTAPVREAWNRALPRRVGDLRGPLLRQDDRYQVVIPRSVPKGTYRFFCLPHRAYDEGMEVEVK